MSKVVLCIRNDKMKKLFLPEHFRRLLACRRPCGGAQGGQGRVLPRRIFLLQDGGPVPLVLLHRGRVGLRGPGDGPTPASEPGLPLHQERLGQRPADWRRRRNRGVIVWVENGAR